MCVCVCKRRNLASDLRLVFAVEDLKRRVYYVERLNERGGQNNGLRQLSVSAAPLSVMAVICLRIRWKVSIVRMRLFRSAAVLLPLWLAGAVRATTWTLSEVEAEIEAYEKSHSSSGSHSSRSTQTGCALAVSD